MNIIQRIGAALMGSALTEAYLPSGAQIDADDHLYSPITGTRRDLNPIDQDRAQEVSFHLWRNNALIHRLLEMLADFVMGDGLTIEAIAKERVEALSEATDPGKAPRLPGDADFGKVDKTPGQRADDRFVAQVQRVIDEFWTDPVMELPLHSRDWVRDQAIFGELAFRAFVNPVSGRMRLAVVDVRRIKDVLPDPENAMVDKWLVVRTLDSPEGVPVPIVTYDDTTDPAAPRWVGEAFYFAPVRAIGQHRGSPDILPVADHADGYDQVIFNATERSGLVNAFIFDVMLQGADDKQIEEWKAKHGTPPRPGSVRVHNEKEVWGTQAPVLGSYEAQALANMVKLVVLGGMGVPEGWFADGDSANRATLQEQGDPTYRMIQSRQRRIKHQWERVLLFVIQCAIDAGRLPADAFERVTINVSLPEPSSEDITNLGKVLVDLVGAFSDAVADEMVSKVSARKLFLQVASMLGIELDPTAEEALIEDERALREQRAADATAEQTRVETQTLLDRTEGKAKIGVQYPRQPTVVDFR